MCHVIGAGLLSQKSNHQTTAKVSMGAIQESKQTIESPDTLAVLYYPPWEWLSTSTTYINTVHDRLKKDVEDAKVGRGMLQCFYMIAK